MRIHGGYREREKRVVFVLQRDDAVVSRRFDGFRRRCNLHQVVLYHIGDYSHAIFLQMKPTMADTIANGFA